jgi:putative nucleotidyltransferase with HDIG domain
MDPQIVSALVRIVEMKDASTAAHNWRVTLYAQALAEAMELPRGDVERIMLAAVLHDIGKIDVPSEILAKPGRLTEPEYSVIKTHTVLGHERLVRMGETDPLILALVRSHHERMDGSGYPDGLRGEAIPPAARMFAVIDTFDALTSRRPYRQDVGAEAAARAVRELQDRSVEWYDPEAVALFARLFRGGSLDWILHHLNDEHSLVELPAAPRPEQLQQARQMYVQSGRLIVPGPVQPR